MAEGGGGNGSPALPNSFAATLAGLVKSVGVEDGDGETDADTDITAAATFLKPYIDRLVELETGLPPFPDSPAATPWHKIENEVLDPNACETVIDIARRHGGTRNHTYGWSKKRRWKERRSLLLEIQARMTASATMLALGAKLSPARKALGEEEETSRTLALLDRTLAIYETQLESGQVPVRPGDVDKIVRLAKFLRGHADHITERRLAITPATVLAAAKAAAKSVSGGMDPELAGVVQDAEFEIKSDDDAAQGGTQSGDSELGSETPSEQAPPPPDPVDKDVVADAHQPDQNGGRSSPPPESSPPPDAGGVSDPRFDD